MPGERLTATQVGVVYRQILGREPSDGEIASHLASVPDLDSMLRVALDSMEYLLRIQATLAPPPATRSPDGDAVVGYGGTLFLCGGINSNLEQFLGEMPMSPQWLEEWRGVIAGREEEIDRLGLAAAFLVIPDKLAVHEDLYPGPLAKRGPRAIERLLELPGLAIRYPLAELRETARTTDVYLRTDTHLTFRGNETLCGSLQEPLAFELPDFTDLTMATYPSTGDLGSKFEPPIVGVVSEPGNLGRAEIVADNRAEFEAIGGHIGTRRVFHNDGAPDRRVAVIFGDSFGFAGPSYQGVAWFMAQVFREVHFVWIPFGWDPDYVQRNGAEVILIQGAERFAARVPRRRVIVSEVIEGSLRRKESVGLEDLFDWRL
jgi:alginate O-acetyltransferase complex protein AlgJ